MSIHVAITRKVREGAEAEYEEKLRRFVQSSLSAPGTRGVQMLHPAPQAASREYGILRSFATAEDRDAFYQSPMYAEWEKDVAHLVEGKPGYRDLHGLEAWFEHPELPRPPRWKLAVATLVGVYPTSLFLGTFVAPQVHHLHRSVTTLIIASCMVAALTWLVMPLVTKVMHRWLHPAE